MNPGGSVKDRAALGLVNWAEKAGKIKAGGTIVEGTAGNTGIGLAHVCRAKGYKCVIYMPNVRSHRRIVHHNLLMPSLRPPDAISGENRLAQNARSRSLPRTRSVASHTTAQPLLTTLHDQRSHSRIRKTTITVSCILTSRNERYL